MNEQLERLSKMVESEEPIPFRDFGKLSRCLRLFDKSGKDARVAPWSIGRGGYDMDWQINYEDEIGRLGTPVVESVAGRVEIIVPMYRYIGWEKLLKVLKKSFPYNKFGAMERDVYPGDEDEPVGEAKMVEEDEDYASMVGADQLAKQFGLSDGQTKLLTKMFNKVAGAALKGGVGGLRNRLMGRGGDDEEVIDVTPKQVDVNTDVLHGALAMDAPVDMNTPCVAKLARMDGSAYYVFNWDGDDTIKAYYVDGEGNNGMITTSYKDALVDGYEPISYKETLGEIKDNEDF